MSRLTSFHQACSSDYGPGPQHIRDSNCPLNELPQVEAQARQVESQERLNLDLNSELSALRLQLSSVTVQLKQEQESGGRAEQGR